MARKRRCSLCGERLDSSLRCTVCGLDNSKNDDMYKHLLNQSTCADEPLTHVHEEPKVNPNYGKVTYTYKNNVQPVGNTVRNTAKRTKRKGSLIGKIISLFVIFSTVIPAIITIVSEMNYGVHEESIPEYGYTQIQDYENEYWLSPGLHEVGVQIPEGECMIALEYGDYAGIEVLEFDGESFWSKEFCTLAEEEFSFFELEEGDFVSVSVNDLLLDSVWLYTDSGNFTEAVYVDYSEIYPVTEDMVAGTDFPAGVYDIIFSPIDKDTYGSVNLLVQSPGTVGSMWEQSFYFEVYEESYECSEDNIYGYVVNIPLTSGTFLDIEEGLEGIYLYPSYEVGQDMYDITWGGLSLSAM